MSNRPCTTVFVFFKCKHETETFDVSEENNKTFRIGDHNERMLNIFTAEYKNKKQIRIACTKEI